MFINSLKYPYSKRVDPTEEEDLDKLLFEEVEVNIECALDRAYHADLNGDYKCANLNYKSVMYYYFIIEYIKLIRRYAERVGVQNLECTPNTIKELFKVTCVENNLPCIGKTYNQNYIGFLKKGFDIAGIAFGNVKCSTCCEGLGFMVLEGSNDCNAFIINTCEELNNPDEDKPGEFTVNEFINIERT